MEFNFSLLLVHLDHFHSLVILCNVTVNDLETCFFLLKNLLLVNSPGKFSWIKKYVTVRTVTLQRPQRASGEG